MAVLLWCVGVGVLQPCLKHVNGSPKVLAGILGAAVYPMVSLPGSGLRAATVLVIDMIAVCLMTHVSNANPNPVIPDVLDLASVRV